MDKNLSKDLVKTGTTILSLKYKDGVVIAGDRRVSAEEGLFIAHKHMLKVIPITDKLVVATAGLVSDIQLLVKLVKAELKLEKLKTKRSFTVKETANLLSNMTYRNIRQISPIPGIVAFIIGGVDKKGEWIFSIGADGSILDHGDYVANGSGKKISYGVLESQYKKNLSEKEAIDLAVKSLLSAMQRDAPTGEGIDVYIINKKGIKKMVDEEIVSVIKKKK